MGFNLKFWERGNEGSAQRARNAAIIVGGAVIVAALIVAIILSVIVLAIWTPNTEGDRWAAEADVLAGAGLLLAVAAAVVAVLTFVAAIQAPELLPVARFGNDNAQFQRQVATYRFRVDATQTSDGLVQLMPGEPMNVKLALSNLNDYTARNPALRLRLIGLSGLDVARAAGWKPDLSQEGVQAIQWDGGADFAVHGHWTRYLPPIDFTGVQVRRDGERRLELEIVAEGFRKTFTVNVEI